MEFYINSTLIRITLSLFMSGLISFVSIPSIVDVANSKHLFDEPNGRTSHIHATPTLGGLAIFAAITITLLTFFNFANFPHMQYVVAASIIIFFIGIKDDILAISPIKKLASEIIASLIIIVLGNMRFSSLHGFLGIHAIPYFLSVIITLFVMIVIINCFNLIDGIDGLAGGMSIITSLTFGIWFYLVGDYEFVALIAAMIGAVVPFVYFNVWGTKNKIFMGDTGSLLLGLLMSVLVIRFNELNIQPIATYGVSAAPAVSFGILIVPLYDTLRVFTARLLQGKSPFSPDRGHVHHRLLKLKQSHRQATLILLGINIFFIIVVYILKDINLETLFLLLFMAATLLSYIPVSLLKRKVRIENEKIEKKNNKKRLEKISKKHATLKVS